MSRLSRFAWAVVAYNLFVIMFGAWVRITGSGAGCGEHWPTCRGEILPRDPGAATIIEFSHRLTSGLSLVLVVVLLVWAFRATPRGHAARKSAASMAVFILLEALIGAGLVLFRLVEKDDSAARAVVIAIHLVNTLGLIASGALTAWFTGAPRRRSTAVPERGWLLAGLVALALVSATGAITALGDTLFPVDAAVVPDHFLVHLRIVHPVLALGAVVLLTIVSSQSRTHSDAPDTTRAAKRLVALTHTQLLIGVANIALRAPGWMQVVHLFCADLVWLALVVLCATRLFPSDQ